MRDTSIFNRGVFQTSGHLTHPFIPIEIIGEDSKNFADNNIDGFVKSPLYPLIVIPAKAGIHSFQVIMDSRFRGNDSICDFLRFHQHCDLIFPLNK